MFYAEWISGMVIAWAAYKAFGFFVQKKLREMYTAMEDISLLGLPHKNGRKIHGTAVVCGGSVAGLLSARVCADHFENVIVVEPEAWVATEEGVHDSHRETLTTGSTAPKRSRVPQTTSLHVYQLFMDLALEKLFPEFKHEMERAGALFSPADWAWHVSGVAIPAPYHQYPFGLPEVLNVTRSRFETTLRKLVLSHCPNVKYVTGSVCGVVPHPSRNAIAAVKFRTTDVEEATEIPAALVVDCTGPTTGGLRWLQDAAFQGQKSNTDHTSLPLCRLKTTYDPKVAYSTCEFDIPPPFHENIRALVHPQDYHRVSLYTCLPKGEQDRFLMSVQRREGNYLQVLCGGWNYRDRITSVADIREFVSRLITDSPVPTFVYTLLSMLEQENVPVTYVHARVPPRVYVQYSRATQLPMNFVAVGDSVLQINPVHGEGCTKACVDAVTLNALLSKSASTLPDCFSRTFFSIQARRTGSMWNDSKYADYAWNSTVPESGEDLKSSGAFQRWYTSKFIALATKDRDVASDMWHATHFLMPPVVAFSPRTVLKILWMQITHILTI